LAPWLNCSKYTVKYSILSQNVQKISLKEHFKQRKLV
jgi:hypothetical protein